MTNVPIGTDTYQRRRASEPDIQYINRFYETDPTDQVNGVASIRRPGLYPRIQVGAGPIRRIFTQSGFALDDAFVVSKTELYRLHSDAFGTGDNLTLIDGTISGVGTPSIVADKNHMFIADGLTLQYTDGTAPLAQIEMPDDVAVNRLAIVDEFIFISIEQDLVNGHQGDQFYWINPGELVVDPLNFATAESSPDIILDLQGIGDQLLILGKDSTEFWYGTGATDLPFSPIQGRPYSRGVWGGTAIRVTNTMITVGADGRVYEISDTANPISAPGIEERIRNAMQIQQLDL